MPDTLRTGESLVDHGDRLECRPGVRSAASAREMACIFTERGHREAWVYGSEPFLLAIADELERRDVAVKNLPPALRGRLEQLRRRRGGNTREVSDV